MSLVYFEQIVRPSLPSEDPSKLFTQTWIFVLSHWGPVLFWTPLTFIARTKTVEDANNLRLGSEMHEHLYN